MSNLKEKINNHIYFFYTILFSITCIGVFWLFIYYGKSFIWTGDTKDGLVQHYNSLMYYGKYLRYIITHFELPMWNFNIGQGADIISTLHYYCIGDPLNLLSVLVPPQYTEYLYEFLIILRLYLSGLMFILYCNYIRGKSAYNVLGAITYVFCGYAIVTSVRHPYFINPMIYLPILLIGVEKIYQHKSPFLFIFTVFLSVISNFYFFYILVIITILYTIIRFFDYYHNNYLKEILLNLGKFILYSIIGVLIGCIILIPVIYLFLNTARSSESAYIPLLYGIKYYINLFFGCLSSAPGYNSTYTYYSGSLFISIILLFIDKRNHKSLKIGFIIMTLMLCIPLIGSIMNGFSYVINRWIFVYSMLLSYILVVELPNFFDINKKQIVIIFIAITIYCLGAFFNEKTNTLSNHIAMIMLVIYFLIILINYIYKRKRVYINKSIILILLSLTIILNISFNSYYKFSKQNGASYIKDFLNYTIGYETLNNSRTDLINSLNDNTFYRVDGTNISKNINSGLQGNYSSLSFFYSLGNGYITQYFDEIQNGNYLSSYYQGVNFRTFLNTLASSKYFITTQENEEYIPYGYTYLKQNKEYEIYQNNYTLPLGYTYKYTISQSEYNKLTSLQKQEALLQCAVINDGSDNYDSKEIKYNHSKLNYKIIENNNVEITDNIIKVKQNNVTLKIKINKSMSGELYVCLNNLEYINNKNKLSDVSISFQKDDSINSSGLILRTPYDSYYRGTKDYTLNLGYSTKTPTELTITFSDKGDYKLDSINFYAQSMKDYSNYVKELKENTLEDIEINTNEIKGNISLNEDKLLCLTIPYSNGWKAYVDDKEVELKRINTMYMGIDLNSGSHNIKLVYKTPGLNIGASTSCIGFLDAGILYVYRKRKGLQDEL